MTAAIGAEIEWIVPDDIPVAPSVIGSADDRRRRRAVAVLLAVGLALVHLLTRFVPGEPSPPELSVDPPAGLYALPALDSDFVVSRVGDVVRSEIPFTDHDGPATVLLPDPGRSPDNSYLYRPAVTDGIFHATRIDLSAAPIHIVTASSTDPLAALGAGGTIANAERTEIRGVDGWVTAATRDGRPAVALAWQATPGRIVKIVGEVTTARLFEVADSLEYVDLNEWLSRPAWRGVYERNVRLHTCLTANDFTLPRPPTFDDYLAGDSQWLAIRDFYRSNEAPIRVPPDCY